MLQCERRPVSHTQTQEIEKAGRSGVPHRRSGKTSRKAAKDSIKQIQLGKYKGERDMTRIQLKWCAFFALALLNTMTAFAEGTQFSVLHTFDVADAVTGASQTGSQPDTRPVLGADGAVYGMTYTGGVNGNGVIYRYDSESGKYSVLHTFGALDANGANSDGANPGVALTRGPDDVFYGMAQFGGTNGAGTIFKITASGKFTVLHAFSAVDSNLHNPDGANPLRTVLIGADGNLYGTTRLGGLNTCGPRASGCGVAWVMTPWGSFSVLHQFQATEGHAASLLQARDGFLYGCAVFPFAAAGSGTLFRMAPSGGHFEILHRFGAVVNGANSDGADCYEPLVETDPGVFFGSTTYGGPNGNGVVFRYSSAKGLEIVHAFSAWNAAGENADGANPFARLTRGEDGVLYSTASGGGAYGNGVVYRIRPNGNFKVLYTFSAADPITGSNVDGVWPDYGVVLHDDSLIGIANVGGKGSVAGATGNGTLYRLKLEE
jgi:uncharacterized repeat protein (TIGR03803 family)